MKCGHYKISDRTPVRSLLIHAAQTVLHRGVIQWANPTGFFCRSSWYVICKFFYISCISARGSHLMMDCHWIECQHRGKKTTIWIVCFIEIFFIWLFLVLSLSRNVNEIHKEKSRRQTNKWSFRVEQKFIPLSFHPKGYWKVKRQQQTFIHIIIIIQREVHPGAHQQLTCAQLFWLLAPGYWKTKWTTGANKKRAQLFSILLLLLKFLLRFETFFTHQLL